MQIKYILLRNFKRMPLRDTDTFEHTFNSKITLIKGINGSGKAQPLNSYIKVPGGWELMKNIKVGSMVIAKDGSVTKVNGVFPQGKKDIFKLTFRDGRTTRCTGDHLWKVYLNNKYPVESKILTTLEIIKILNNNKLKTTNKTFVWIDLPDSEMNEDKLLHIDPYILGVLLGDGCLRGSGVICHPDKFIMDKIRSKLETGISVSVRNMGDNHCLTYSIISNKPSNCNQLTNYLRDYGLMDKLTHEKFIPEEYLYASHNQRLELLQGLMDTDGTIDKQGISSYCTTSYILAKQVQYLIRSLGGIASISIRNPFFTNSHGEKQAGGIAYQINIRYKKPSELFTLPKKQIRTNGNNQYSPNLKLCLFSIEEDGIEEAQCISIDHPSHLYITDDFIVTHNTSLANELTPLPSDKNNYNKDGYKEIHIEKDGRLFKLISDFTDCVKYYFYVDDENINPSNNVTMQRDLVFRYFGITPNIHDILTGLVAFTNMSLLNRKKLFKSITHLNIDKVLENYNLLKEELKNNEFLLKTQISLLQSEESKVSNIEYYNSLLDIQLKTKEYIDYLLNLRTELYRDTSTLSINETYDKYKEVYDEMSFTVKKYYTYITSYSIDNLPSLQSKLEIVKYKLIGLYSSIEKTNEEINILSLNRQHSITDLIQKLDNIKLSMSNIANNLFIVKDVDIDLDSYRNDIIKLETSLTDILLNIPINSDKRYSKDKYEELLNIKKILLDSLTSLIKEEAEIDSQISYSTNLENNITCPSCSYTWLNNKDIPELDILKVRLNNILTKKLEIKSSIETTDKNIQDILDYFNIYRQYNSIKKSTMDNLKQFWDIIDREMLIFNEPNKILYWFKILQTDIMNIGEYYQLYDKYRDINYTIDSLSKLQDTSIDLLLGNINKLEEEVSLLNEEQDVVLTDIKNTQIAKIGLDYINTSRNALKASRSNLQDANISYTISNIINEIDSELSKYKVNLIEIEKEIATSNSVKYTIIEYKKQIEEIQTNIKVLNIALTELSPKNGLIAKSVSSFLNVIISNINVIINSIWEYKMELKAIDIEDEVLNYKFKVVIEDSLIVDDISTVSTGMREIINLSFKNLMYKLLKLENYPIILDELAANLDSVHSGKMLQYIHNLGSDSCFSQVFLITHKENLLFLPNIDIVELS